MPKAYELPEAIAALAGRNAIELSEARFDYDAERLIRAIEPSDAVSGRWWGWLSDEKRQRTLAFLGAGFVAVVAGLWQVYVHFSESPKATAPPSISASQGGLAPGRDNVIHGPVIQNRPHATVEQHNYYGALSEERAEALIAELGVTRAALQNFFKILEQQQVAPNDLDATLRTVASRYKELLARLSALPSDDAEVATLKRQAKESLQALGPDHPDVATSLNNLAGLYRAQGQQAKAETLEARAKAISAHGAMGTPP